MDEIMIVNVLDGIDSMIYNYWFGWMQQRMNVTGQSKTLKSWTYQQINDLQFPTVVDRVELLWFTLNWRLEIRVELRKGRITIVWKVCWLINSRSMCRGIQECTLWCLLFQAIHHKVFRSDAEIRNPKPSRQIRKELSITHTNQNQEEENWSICRGN